MLRTLSIVLASVLLPAVALAQTQPPAQGADTDGDGADEDAVAPGDASSAPNDGDVPKPTSDDDPTPEVATPAAGGFVEQAGIGGSTGYGRAGVLELGGSAGFRLGSDFSQVNVAPSIGWFIADNFQISGIIDLGYISAEDADGSTADATIFSAIVEPSYHLPFTRSLFGFLGLGVGGSYVSDLGGGFVTAPRVGANFLVGRSGLLTPSLSWQYTTHDVMDDEDQQTTAAVSSALRLNVGYTVMW